MSLISNFAVSLSSGLWFSGFQRKYRSIREIPGEVISLHFGQFNIIKVFRDCWFQILRFQLHIYFGFHDYRENTEFPGNFRKNLFLFCILLNTVSLKVIKIPNFAVSTSSGLWFYGLQRKYRIYREIPEEFIFFAFRKIRFQYRFWRLLISILLFRLDPGYGFHDEVFDDS